MYGSQLVQETKLLSCGAIIIKEGSLYPVLYKLLEDDYISSQKVLIGKHMTREYYHLEPKGDAYREEFRKAFSVFADGLRRIMGGERSYELRQTFD